MNSNYGFILGIWVLLLYQSKVFSSSPCFFWDDARYLDGYCYKVFNVSKTWTEAQDACAAESYPSKLAEPLEERRMAILRAMAFFYDQSLWIGGFYDSSNNVFKWKSSGVAIATEQLALAGGLSLEKRLCVAIDDWGWRMLKYNDCQEMNIYICEKYVGDPCKDTIPGADFYGGYCFQLHNKFVYYMEAKETCESYDAILAEPQTEELYAFLEGFADREAEVQVLTPSNSGYVDLKNYDLTLEGRESLSFLITACEDAQIAIWEETSMGASSNPSSGSTGDIGGANGKYYEIIINRGGKNYLKFCSNNNCAELLKGSKTVLDCQKAVKLELKLEPNIIQLKNTGINYDILKEKKDVMQFNRIAVAMGRSSGVWLFQGGINNTDIFLGATDWNHEGLFTWLSNDENVTLVDWLGGEPNDWKGHNGEDEVAWRNLNHGLNDINGSATAARFICQKGAHKFTYVAVLPEIGTGHIGRADIEFTTGYTDFVFLRIKQRRESAVTETMKWIKAERDAHYSVDPEIEMTDSGIHSGSVEILSNFDVTVVIHVEGKQQQYLRESTLIFPVNNMAAEYFVLASYEPKSGSQVTVTALQDNTEIIIKIPNYAEGVIVTLNGVSYRLPRTGTTKLDGFESFQLQTTGDVSGCFIYSKKPAVVYVGSKGIWASNPSTDASLDTLLSVNSLAVQYITFPSIPLTATQSDSFRVMAVFDNTQLKVHGPNTQEFDLEKATNVQEISLPRNGFYVIEGSYEFYAMKTAKEAACISSLIPSTFWREQYDFKAQNSETILIVISKNKESQILLDYSVLTTQLTCLPIRKTSLSGCYFQPGAGLHHLRASTSGTKFAAYSFYTGSPHYSGHCHPLGVNSAIATYDNKIFDSESYIDAPECTPTLHPNETVSEEEIEELQKAIEDKLRVNSRTTSAFRRTKESAEDHRVSSKTIAASGIALITLTFLLLVFPDALRVFIYFSKLCSRSKVN